jgi:hypothetical protein
VKAWPRTAGVLEDRALGRLEQVQARGDERVQGLRDVEVLDLAGQDVARALLGQEPAVEQHAHGFHGVERDALGAPADACQELLAKTRDEACQQLVHRPVGERREPDGRLTVDLRPGQAEHEDGEVGRPLEQVVDEVQEAAVGPVEVLEHEDDGLLGGHGLEVQPPAREQVGAVGRDALLQRQQMGEARLDQPSLPLVGDEPLHDRPQLRPGGLGVLVLRDPRTRPDHVGQRPVGDTLAVGQAAPALPEDLRGDPVDVLLELPRQAGLPHAGLPGHEHELRLALALRALGRVDDDGELASAPDEGRLQPDAAPRSAHAGHDAQRRPGVHRLLAPLDLVAAGVLVGDGGLGGAAGDVVDEHAPGGGDGLEARGGVDGVAQDHPLTLGADLDRGGAGEHAGAGAQVRHAHLGAEGRHRAGEVERRADRALGVVLAGDRGAPHRHHGIADEPRRSGR